MIRLVVCHAEAPSIAAASRSSAGMPCSPASSRMTPNPMNCQVSTTNIVYSTMVGFASHSCTRPPSPTALISSSTNPPGSRSSSHSTAVVAWETTYGANTASRRNDAPRIRRFSSSAIAMLIGSWMTSDSTAMITLCSSDDRNTGSAECQLVVVQAGEVGQRTVAGPVEQPIVGSDADRQQHKAGEQHQRRADQHDQLDDLAARQEAPAAGRRLAAWPERRPRQTLLPRPSLPGDRSLLLSRSLVDGRHDGLRCGLARVGEEVRHRGVERRCRRWSGRRCRGTSGRRTCSCWPGGSAYRLAA